MGRRRVLGHRASAGRRDDADEPAQEGDGLNDEVGAAVGPRSLVGDAPIGGPREALLRERGACAVAAQPFERGAIVRGDDDARVQREAFAPRAEPLDAANGRTILRRGEEVQAGFRGGGLCEWRGHVAGRASWLDDTFVRAATFR